MQKQKVSIVKYGNDRENIKKALEMCGGLEKIKKLSPSDRVLIKPNLVMWDSVLAFPKYGVLTTSVVVEEIVKLLAENGLTDISIGEASSEDKSRGSSTVLAYEGLGYHKLESRYGVKLLDFNRGPFTEVDFGDFKLNIAAEALETNFLIDIPVLKTHNSTKVSLGFKNLKGCLDRKSKMLCHNVNIPLDNFVSHLGERLNPGLTVIDGIFTMERGPAVNGTAHRADLIISSTDIFSADTVGSMVMGFEPGEIDHLSMFAQRNGLSLDAGNIDIVGEPLASVTRKLRWDWEWKADNSGPPAFERMGITGINYPKYDETICSTCSFFNNLILILLLGSYDGKPFPNIEFLTGKKMFSEGGYDKTFLFGKCIAEVNKDNPNIKQAVKIKGCPPTMDEIVKVLNENGVKADLETYRQYRQSLADRYKGKDEFNDSLFTVS
ncbi:MAG: DUF362 domain-containing protein [Dethiobacter sp.]|nr:DUF362 domain-containing protein [Dethiobacter sp.]